MGKMPYMAMNMSQPLKMNDSFRKYAAPHSELTPEERDELILMYTPLIKYIANRFAARLPPQVAIDDLISCGIIGLIDAINKFDPGKNVQFKTYAEFRIKGSMLDELRAQDWAPRSIRRKITDLEETYSDLEKRLGRPASDDEMANAMHISLEEFHKLLDETKAVTFMDIELVRQDPSDIFKNEAQQPAIHENDDPFQKISHSQIRDLVAKCIEELPEKEKLTVSLYYQEELTMKEIGLILGYTESRISQMHSKAVYRLRSKLKRILAH